MTTVRVGINLLWLVPGEVGGSEESTLASLRALAELDAPGLQLELFALGQLRAAHPDVMAAFPTTTVAAGSSRPLRIAAESTWLAARTRHLDLVHHAGGTAPVRSRPYVLTVHDLQPLERSETHGSVKRRYLAATIPRSIAAARRVVVPSEFVRRSVLDRFGTDPSKVVVVPHGVDAGTATPEAEVRDRYRLDGPVVLFPGITYPHKNHGMLVEAFALVLKAHPDALLVLPGGAGSEEANVLALAEERGVRASVRRPGRVPAADVAALYEMASVVAVPSRYEGFGLPAAEALAHGAPLVAAAATALPEVAGDAALLVDPDDVAGWATAITGLLADPGERARLGAAGRARSERYTWAANAAALVEVYRGAG